MPSTDPALSKSPLKRTLGLGSLVFYGVGIIIGAGIYSVIGAAAGESGYGLWLSFVIAGIAAALTAFSYAELAAAIPRAGAEYAYLARALPNHRWFAFLTGFIGIVSGIATAATVSLAFGGYATLFVTFPPWMAAAVLLVVCAAFNIWGIKQSSWMNIILTTVEVAGLVLVITLGVQAPGFTPERLADAFTPGLFAGAAVIFFVYTGFEDLANLAEESTAPGRDLPRALFICLVVTTTLYVLVALAVLALVTPEELAGSSSPLALAVSKVSERYAMALGYVALVSTANTGLIASIAASRMIFGMARGGELPPSLGRTSARRQTPWVAAIVVLAGAAILLPFGKVAIVASVSSFAALLAFLAVNLAVVLLRYREPDLERPYRVPLTIGRTPVLPILGILSCIALMTQFESIVYAAGGGALVLGMLLYWIRQRVGGPVRDPSTVVA